jgi:hypothetical protein
VQYFVAPVIRLLRGEAAIAVRIFSRVRFVLNALRVRTDKRLLTSGEIPSIMFLAVAFSTAVALTRQAPTHCPRSGLEAYNCHDQPRRNLLGKRLRPTLSAPISMSTADGAEGAESPPAHFSRRDIVSAGIAGLSGISASYYVGALASAAAPPAATSSDVPTTGTRQLVEYHGPVSLGYSFSYPAKGWSVKKKPIKTHMSEVLLQMSSGPASTSAGVTVDAVKISDIKEFGSPDEVGDKVVKLEKRKDNVLDASLRSAAKADAGDLTYYVLEYTVESGRGLKTYLAKATITGGNLFVFTAQAKSADFEGEAGLILSAMVDSFHVMRQYS